MEVQKSIAYRVEEMDIRPNLSLMNVTNNCNILSGEGVDKNFVDEVVKKLIGGLDETSLTSKDMANIALAISKQRDTPFGRYLLFLLVPKLTNLMQEDSRTNSKSALSFALQMAHVGLYEPKLIEEIFDSPYVTKCDKNGNRRIAKEMLYVGEYGNIRAGMVQSAGDLLMLQGMVELELKNYKGSLLAKDVDLEIKYQQMSGTLPLVARASKDPILMKFKSGYFTRTQLSVYDTLVSIFGVDYVLESQVLPFTGFINYVVGIDSRGTFVKMGEDIKCKNFAEASRCLSESDVRWFATFLYHPLYHNRSWVRAGGQPVIQRLLDKQKIQSIFINTEEWSLFEQKQKEEYFKNYFNL